MPGDRARTGLEVLASEDFRSLRGLKVGLVAHPASILPDRTHAADALRGGGVRLAALFGPEHGVRGDVPAGRWVASSTDRATGAPVHSLYGPTRVPTAAMVRGLDLIVYDLQDIGSRSYTYLSTLGAVLEGASRHRVPVLVLDRPNPIGGARVEGGPVRPGFASFVGRYPCAYRHGLSTGEAARWLAGTGRVGRPQVRVVACRGVTRAMETWGALGGLPWVPTSPNVPHPDTPALYAATGIVGELAALSIGVGTDSPFGWVGCPGLEPSALLRALEREDLPGFVFAPARWTPRRGVFAGRACGGVRVRATGAALTGCNFALLSALRRAGVGSLFADRESARMFDLCCGSDAVRRAFLKGAGTAQMVGLFERGVDAFRRERAPFLLHPDGTLTP